MAKIGYWLMAICSKFQLLVRTQNSEYPEIKRGKGFRVSIEFRVSSHLSLAS